jgi:tRNA1(Val) A37 N6-methylase TrmN6
MIFIISNPPFFEGQLVAGDVKKDLAKHSTSLGLSELFNLVEKNIEYEG